MSRNQLDNLETFSHDGAKAVKPAADAKFTKIRHISGLTQFDLTLSESFDGGVYLSDCVDLLNQASDDNPCFTSAGDQDFLLLTNLLNTLCKSKTAVAFVNDAYNDEWFVSFDDLGDQDFVLDIPDGTLTLNSKGLSLSSLFKSHYFKCQITLSLVRALRDMWQEKRQGNFEQTYKADHMLHLERIRAADGETVTTLIAWEIEQAGDATLWRHLISSDEGDIAMAFKNNLGLDYTDHTIIYDAMNYAFNQWFASEDRINACDHDVLEHMDAILDAQGTQAFGHDYIQSGDLEIISCLPNRVAYLQGRGGDLLKNPLYCGMNDSINQSHFMQIVHDASCTNVGGINFRDSDLAAKIFPDLTRSSTVDA